MSRSEDIIARHRACVMPTYAPSRVLVRGQGSYLWDADDKPYLDFMSGVAVTNVGHAHPHVVEAISRQAARLMHVSNLYYNERQPELAEKLSRVSLGGKVFFANSGAEANEGLIKLARRWGHERGRYEIICMHNSFHGRTLATLTATGQDKVKKGFEPLPEGFVHAEFNNPDSVEALVTDRTVAVLVEPVQGEGGVRPAEASFMRDLQLLCEEQHILLLCDEVQAGNGRTGTWYGYQQYSIQPDAFATAKGLGGGFPIGAVVAGEKLSDVFQPGSHATTYGGSPLTCAAALAVMEVIEQENLLENTAQRGAQLMHGLKGLVDRFDDLEAARGIGLLVGLVLKGEARPLEHALADRGLLTIATAGNVVRMVPPLNVSEEEVNQALGILEEACTSLYAS